jgi:hypothetical protein
MFILRLNINITHPKATELIQMLLKGDPVRITNLSDIKKCKWFEDFYWMGLAHGPTKLPCLPKLQNDNCHLFLEY